MKLPGTAGKIQDLAKPTRRKFLGMAGAAVLPKPPIAVGEILEGVGTMRGGGFYSALKKLPIRFFEYEKWAGGDEGKLVGFPTKHQPLISRKIKSELGSYLSDLEKLLGTNSDLLRFFDPENSYLQPEVSSYEANLEQGDVDGEFDFLDMVLNFKIPGENNDEEFFIEMNICPCEDGVNEPLNIGNSGVTLGRIDKKLGRITDEYEIDLMDDNDIFEILRKPLKELLPSFKKHSWHRNHEAERVKQKKEKLKEDSQLPIVQTEFSELMNQILSGKIKITEKVRDRVRYLITS